MGVGGGATPFRKSIRIGCCSRVFRIRRDRRGGRAISRVPGTSRFSTKTRPAELSTSAKSQRRSRIATRVTCVASRRNADRCVSRSGGQIAGEPIALNHIPARSPGLSRRPRREGHRARKNGGAGTSPATTQGVRCFNPTGSRSKILQALIETLVVQRSAHGSELLAEFLGGGGGDMGVVRAAVLPDFHDREVVRPVVLLPRLEALRIRFLAGVLGELLEHGNAIVLAGRDDVYVGDGIDRALAGRRRSDSDAIARPLVIKACLQRLELVFELLQGPAASMALAPLLVPPRFQNDELVFAVDALENIVALIAGFLAACRGTWLEGARRFTLGGRHDLDVSDNVGGSSRPGLRHGGRGGPHGGGHDPPPPKKPHPFSPFKIQTRPT